MKSDLEKAQGKTYSKYKEQKIRKQLNSNKSVLSTL